jgi:hypothetical protein
MRIQRGFLTKNPERTAEEKEDDREESGGRLSRAALTWTPRFRFSSHHALLSVKEWFL